MDRKKAMEKEKRKKKDTPMFEFSKEQLLDVKRAFEIFDHEGTGLLPSKYLRVILRAYGFDSDRDAINRLVYPLDKDYDDKLNYEEFESILQRLMTDESPVEFQMKAFQLYYHNSNGKISFDELKQISSELGDNISEESIRDMLWGATKGMSEEVDIEDFRGILKPPEPF